MLRRALALLLVLVAAPVWAVPASVKTAVVWGGQSNCVNQTHTNTWLSQTQSLNNVQWSDVIYTATLDVSGGITTTSELPSAYADLVENINNKEGPRSAAANVYATTTGNPLLAMSYCLNGTAGVYSGIGPGSPAWTRLNKQLSAWGRMEHGERVAALMWRHGESDEVNDITQAAYLANLVAVQPAFQTLAWALTETRTTVPMIMLLPGNWTATAVGSHTKSAPALAMVQAAQENPTTHFVAAPQYQITYNTDGVHADAQGSFDAGAWAGQALAAVDQTGTWTPTWVALTPGCVRAAAIITCTLYAPTPPLVFDTALVSDPGTKGVTYTDDTSSAAVSSVAFTACTGHSCPLVITLDGTPTGANPYVQIAYPGTGGTNGGPTTGPRANVRDSATGTWGSTPLYNWAVPQKVPVTS